MKTVYCPFISEQKNYITNNESVINFYNNATPDYKYWSTDLNMHFGYYKPFKTNFFKRDSMLNAMNAKVFSLLKIKNQKTHILDLGCGVGSSLRYASNNYPNMTGVGITISPVQIKMANKLTNSNKISFLNRDYQNTEFKEASFNGAIAIESLCHTGCSRKALEETYRILKPNSKFVIADAFCKKNKNELNILSKTVYNGLCNSWSLENLGNIKKVKQELQEIGFKEVTIKNIWYRVAPSVLHIPFSIAGFICKQLFKKKELEVETINNLKGSFYTFLTALCLQDFGYYIITAKK